MAFRFGDRRDWFFEARYGMFVHWGIYALDAWHEQQHYRLGMSRNEYRQLAGRFDPQSFDPDAWVDLAEQCDMRYLVVTAKHIDGFCMFDSAASDFTVMNTPYAKDIIGQIAEVCHRRSFPFGVYFSALDNLHPNYPRSGKAHESPAEPGDQPEVDAYMDDVKTQVRELCTNYGPLSVFWWDANRSEMQDPSINAMIRELQPGCVINDRGWDGGDFGTPERSYDSDSDGMTPFSRPTEACESVGSQSWGFRSDEDYFTPLYLMRRLDLMMARGANYLLNVGPDADGCIPDRQQDILRRIGRWYARVREAFADTVPAPDVTLNREVLVTRKENTMYVHLVREPRCSAVVLHPLNTLPERAVLLNTGDMVQADLNRLPSLHRESAKTCLRLYDLPVEELVNEVPVIRLDFAGSTVTTPEQRSAGTEDDLATR